MFLKNLTLQNFRSFKKDKLNFDNDLTVIIGPNTSGKTNILEAIFLIANGSSFRAEKDLEMISYQEEIARASSEIIKTGEQNRLEVVLTRGRLYGRGVSTKRYFLNGLSKKMTDFVGQLKVSLFWPEDLELITDSPSIRRNYLNFILSEIDKDYLIRLRIYEKSLRARNKLLERIREKKANQNELIYWNNLLIENGNYLISKRQQYIDFINKNKQLTDKLRFKIIYKVSPISEKRLNQYVREEIMAGVTLVGPHRDDMKFEIKNSEFEIRDLSLYGSRGEQRLGVLWLKLGELAFIEEKSQGEKPVLLLDDIFSELDYDNRQFVLKYIPNQQTIITATDLNLIEDKLKKQAQIIKLV